MLVRRIGFEAGRPVTVNGASYGPVAIIETLNAIAARNGVGRTDITENRLVGMKSRGVYETPGGTVLYEAHDALEMLTLDRDTLHFKEQLALRYAEMVYFGKWYNPLREALDAFVASTQRTVTGTVRVKLYKGNCTAVGTRSTDNGPQQSASRVRSRSTARTSPPSPRMRSTTSPTQKASSTCSGSRRPSARNSAHWRTDHD